MVSRPARQNCGDVLDLVERERTAAAEKEKNDLGKGEMSE